MSGTAADLDRTPPVAVAVALVTAPDVVAIDCDLPGACRGDLPAAPPGPTMCAQIRSPVAALADTLAARAGRR